MSHQAGFVLPPLRGYVPYGELDVQYDLMRAPLAWEIAMWEGCDWPHLVSRPLPGVDGVWVRPTPSGLGPSWNYKPASGNIGFPKSGHAAMHVFAGTGKGVNTQRLRYENIWDPILSQFVVGYNFSILIVGTPMTAMLPDLGPLSRGAGWRYLFAFRKANGEVVATISFKYDTEQIQSTFLAAGSIATPIVPYYGRRIAFLFCNGDEGGVIPSPRVYFGSGDGQVTRADFSHPGAYSMFEVSMLDLFGVWGADEQDNTAGGCWEYCAYFIRSFSEPEARAIVRDAVGMVKMDPYVVRRTGWRPRIAQLIAQASVYGRVSAKPGSSPRVTAEPSTYARVSASARSTGPRVTAEPTNFPRISARIRIADQEANMQATPLCPAEMNWMADNVLELSEVLDDMQTPPDPITSADSVTVEIWDRDTDTELTVVSPVTLSQVGATNAWRDSVLVNESNGFAEKQRLVLIFIFDGGAGLQGRFYALAVVAAATS